MGADLVFKKRGRGLDLAIHLYTWGIIPPLRIFPVVHPQYQCLKRTKTNGTCCRLVVQNYGCSSRRTPCNKKTTKKWIHFKQSQNSLRLKWNIVLNFIEILLYNFMYSLLWLKIPLSFQHRLDYFHSQPFLLCFKTLSNIEPDRKS